MTPFILPAVSLLVLEQKLIEAGLKIPTETGYVNAPGVELSYFGGQSVVSGLIPDTMDAVAIKALLGKDLNLAGIPVRSFLGQPAPEVETVVDNLQIRLAMSEIPYGQGTLLDAVEAFVAEAPLVVQIWWRESLRFIQSDPMVQGAAAALKVPSEQLAGLWQLAASK